MEEPSIRPPPLPPKVRKSPPVPAATVLTNCIIQDDYDRNLRYSSSLSSHSEPNTHVVKIQINPSQDSYANGKSGTTSVTCVVSPCIKISVNTSDGEMVQNKTMVDSSTETTGYFFYDQFHGSVMSSGQISPSDTLDSGTCSDLDGTPPPVTPKKSTGISVTIIGEKTKRLSSLNSSGTEVDSDDNESSTSYDSFNSKKVPLIIDTHLQSTPVKLNSAGFLPQTLLQDIRNAKLNLPDAEIQTMVLVEKPPSEEPKKEKKQDFKEIISSNRQYESDMYYNFHLNENVFSDSVVPVRNVEQDETFAGYKDLLGDGAATIRSAKGTVRGVKNRVRAGIATFLQINSNIKNYKEKEAGKVVVYTTTMGIIRDTYQACMKVKQILRTLLVKFEERDVFMSGESQQEIRERMRCDYILVPQVFVDGQHVGDAETIEKLNESGELRRILKPFKSMDACIPCKMCGGYRLLPCTVCNGSKKSVHRNHFTAEFVALKCMNCDEVGLVKCTTCC